MVTCQWWLYEQVAKIRKMPQSYSSIHMETYFQTRPKQVLEYKAKEGNTHEQISMAYDSPIKEAQNLTGKSVMYSIQTQSESTKHAIQNKVNAKQVNKVHVV